jgi:hypothetical protein
MGTAPSVWRPFLMSTPTKSSSPSVISRQTSLRNQHHLVLAVNPASDEWRASHASPSERYLDRVPYLAIRGLREGI